MLYSYSRTPLYSVMQADRDAPPVEITGQTALIPHRDR